jgi:2-oxoglutarate dehydrogenase complex dehydrogenase (E1) component-like enzyme
VKGTRRRGASLCVLMHGDSAAAGQGVVAEVCCYYYFNVY